MAGYASINRDRLWYDTCPAERGLSDAGFRLFMWALSGPGGNLLGVRRWRPADVLPHMPGWDEAKVAAALAELEALGLVAHDPARLLLACPAVLEHCPVRGLKSLQGAVKLLADLPDSHVLAGALAHLAEAAEETRAGLRDAKRDGPKVDTVAGEIEARAARLPDAPPMGHRWGTDGAWMGHPAQADQKNHAEKKLPGDAAARGDTPPQMGHGWGMDGASGFGPPEPEPEPEPEEDKDPPKKAPPKSGRGPLGWLGR